MTCRILVVDDEPVIRGFVRDALESEGYKVHESGDGHGLPDLIRALDPSCVLLDVMMPGESGEDALAAVVRAGLMTPVILYSAKYTEAAAEVLRMKGEFMGASDYIAKPFDLDRLIASVRKNCGPA